MRVDEGALKASYSPKCVEWAFSKVRIHDPVLASAPPNRPDKDYQHDNHHKNDDRQYDEHAAPELHPGPDARISGLLAVTWGASRVPYLIRSQVLRSAAGGIGGTGLSASGGGTRAVS